MNATKSKSRVAAPQAKAKRTRRNQAEVVQRIVEAASKLFFERGFADTTTLKIAEAAEVSERLIFDYFGSKQGLFDHIVYTPFSQLAEQLLTDLEEEHTPAQLEERGQEVLIRFLQRLNENRHLMSVLAVRGPLNLKDERIAVQVAEMRRNYDRAAKRMAKTTRRRPSSALDETSAGVLVRLLFGMVVGSVLFSDWLFPEGKPTTENLAASIRRIIHGAAS